jgi:hypothetical protein
MALMPAHLLLDEKEIRPDGLIIQRKIWLLTQPVPPCTHRYKYRLFCGRAGQRLVSFDNERGKGDHWHAGDIERPYHFSAVSRLLEDFDAAIAAATGDDR